MLEYQGRRCQTAREFIRSNSNSRGIVDLPKIRGFFLVHDGAITEMKEEEQTVLYEVYAVTARDSKNSAGPAYVALTPDEQNAFHRQQRASQQINGEQFYKTMKKLAESSR
jgi:hypothetical protein